MKASEALKQLRAKGSLDEMLGLLMGEPLQRAMESLEREAEREEKPSTRCSVSIAGGLVHGDFERVTAVQALILENEKLRREARAREEKAKPKVTLKDQVDVVASARCEGFEVQLKAAADTLRRLDEEGGKLMARHANTTFACCCDGCVLAHSLGVEKKP